MDEALDVEGEERAMSVGDRLRAAREQSGLSLEDVATTTRIPTRHLESLETSDFARLPAPTYTVGFAKNYAAAVGLDREEIGDLLRAELGTTRPPNATPDLFEPADPARAMPRWLIFAAIGALLLAVLIFQWLNSRSLEEPDEIAAENVAAPAAASPPPPAAAPAQAQGPVVLTATQQVWIQIKDGSNTLREGLFEPGQSFEIPATAVAPVLTTGKPEALRITVGTTVAPPVGPPATTVSNVSLRPADLLRGPQQAASSPPVSAPATTQAASRRAPARAAARRSSATTEPPPATTPTQPEAVPPPPPAQQQ
jgi:cytoskeleton protein RodZ